MSGYTNLQAGLFSTGNYIISGIPYATGALSVPGTASTPLEIVFPSVTQMIKIHNNDRTTALRVGFSVSGTIGTNYWIVEPHATDGKNTDYVEIRVKTDRIYLSSNHATTQCTGAYVMAELTGIKLDYNLAAAYSGSSGVG